MNVHVMAESFIVNMKLILSGLSHFMTWMENLTVLFCPKFYKWIYVTH